MKKLKLRLIAMIQRRLLKIDYKWATSLYYTLAKKHFKIHFGLDLVEEMGVASEESAKAARRHARMVVAAIYPGSDESTKRRLEAMARGSFTKNLLLESSLLSDDHPMD